MNYNQQINNLLQQFGSGNKESAYKKLLKILNKRKDDFLLRYNIAVIEQELNLNERARSNYKLIIRNQENIKAMVNLYNLDIKEEKYEDALILIEKILEINGNLDFVNKDRAFVFLKLNKIKKSKNLCNTLLSKDEEDKDVLNILGLCYSAEDNFNMASKVFNRILSYDNNNIAALNSLGRLHHEKRNSKEAERYFLKALNLDPSSYQVLNNIAGFYREEGQYKKSINYYLKALNLNPNNSYILNNLSKSYFDINDFNLAESYALKALNYNKEDGNIKKILSFIYLRNQDYKKGWFYFEGRLKNSEFAEKNESIIKLESKLFEKQNINIKKKILILREQGVGDEILYGTMYRDALENLPYIKIECDKRLLNLFKNSFKEYSHKFLPLGEISEDNGKLSEFENVLYAGSLGKFYRKNKKDFISKPYLIADEDKIEKNKMFIDQFGKKINIGFSWKSFKNRYSGEKSLSLNDFNHIFNNKDCNFFNLQYGDVKNELSKYIEKTGVNLITNDELDLFNDFDNLAALLKNLDLFITVSNSTAHLAGALGVKTILIKPKNHALFHYWNQENEKTPWYSSVKLIDKNSIRDKNLIQKNINY